MKPVIIHKDDDIVVIDKPAGLPCVDAKAGMKETLVSWLLAELPAQRRVHEITGEAGLLHRLDNDTSGVVVAAVSAGAYAFLKKKWNSGDVLKEYICLVVGTTPPHGRITTLIAHHPDKRDKMIIAADNVPKARRAETEYEAIETFFDYTLLAVRIKTGVRHQIRCHLSSIGHPIAGDKLYQRAKHGFRDHLALSRHFLHASKIGLPHPADGGYMEFESPLPEDISSALKLLNLGDTNV